MLIVTTTTQDSQVCTGKVKAAGLYCAPFVTRRYIDELVLACHS